MRRHGATRSALALVLVAMVAAGCGADEEAPPPVETVGPTRTAGSGPPAVQPLNLSGRPLARDGGGIAAEDALQRVLATGRFERIVSAEVTPEDDASGLARLRLHTVTRADGNGPGEALRAGWEADLLSGAVAELAAQPAENDLSRVLAPYVDVLQPDGTLLPNEAGGMGAIAPGQAVDDRPDAELQALVRDAVAPYGRLVELRIHRPLGPALAIVLQSDHPERALAAFPVWARDGIGCPTRYDGCYVEVRGPDGAVVARQSVGLRNGAGRLWTAEGYSVGGVQSLGAPQAATG